MSYSDAEIRLPKLEAALAERDAELVVLREFAGSKCTIQKVIDELGPMSLWSKRGLEKHVAERVAEIKQQLADMTADYHRWHDAYMELKYPDGGKRIETTSNDGGDKHG
jgi:hypothetical protein